MRDKLRIGTGASSILMIVITLTLTAFAVLSFITSRSDYRTAAQALETNKNYYAAEGNVQQTLANIDAIMKTSSGGTKINQILGLDDSMTLLSDTVVTFTEPVSENREIVVILDIGSGNDYEILLHEFVNTQTWEIDNSMNLWQE